MTVTAEVRAEILAEHGKNPQRFSPFKTAKGLGVPIQDVIAVVDSSKEAQARGTVRHDGYGHPDLLKHTVARRRAMTGGWNNADPAIAKARKDYEAGTHEMATGKDGPWLILYSIKRRTKGRVNTYFSLENH